MKDANEKATAQFLGQRMRALREKNRHTLDMMAQKLNFEKASLSKIENGKYSLKTTQEKAKEYCKAFGMTEEQIELFLRGERVVVVDTSALMKQPQLLEQLVEEYSRVIVPQIVIDELDDQKDHNEKQSKTAWQILQSIKNCKVIVTKYETEDKDKKNDKVIIEVAINASNEYGCEVEIITNDIGFSARLKCNEHVHALFIEDYMARKQPLTDMNVLKEIDSYYANSYENIEEKLGIKLPESNDDINAYLSTGNTLIISAVRSNQPLEKRKEKIKWLISVGADVNKRDCSKHFFPALSHAIQKGDFEIFKFLLHECGANPNVGSRNPYDTGKTQRADKNNEKNDGNMPLMVAAWHNRPEFVKELCEHKDISINQQDGNGFTALIKACYWRHMECRDILIAHGADQRIVDRNGYTAQGRYDESIELGRNPKEQKSHKKRKRHKK